MSSVVCAEGNRSKRIFGRLGGRSRWRCRVILASANSSEQFSGGLIPLLCLEWQIVHIWLSRALERLKTEV